jgi:hypothetical protein
MNDKSVHWLDGGCEPKVAPNLLFPDGKDLDITHGDEKACKIDLPYPAKRCGMYVITCKTCGTTTGVTTADRPDDPRSVKIPCKVLLN